MVAWADEYSVATERAWAVEGTASYGRGVTAALGQCGEWVVEFDRAKEKPAKDGSKTDELDAIRAARETLGRSRLASPRARLCLVGVSRSRSAERSCSAAGCPT